MEVISGTINSYLTVWPGRLRKHETGSIEPDGDLKGWIWVVSGPESGIQRISVSPKFMGFSLSLNVTFLCKLGRIHDLRCAWEFPNVANSVSGTPFCVN